VLFLEDLRAVCIKAVASHQSDNSQSFQNFGMWKKATDLVYKLPSEQ
jgi:DNA gyrase inhibitor GyrI